MRLSLVLSVGPVAVLGRGDSVTSADLAAAAAVSGVTPVTAETGCQGTGLRCCAVRRVLVLRAACWVLGAACWGLGAEPVGWDRPVTELGRRRLARRTAVL